MYQCRKSKEIPNFDIPLYSMFPLVTHCIFIRSFFLLPINKKMHYTNINYNLKDISKHMLSTDACSVLCVSSGNRFLIKVFTPVYL